MVECKYLEDHYLHFFIQNNQSSAFSPTVTTISNLKQQTNNTNTNANSPTSSIRKRPPLINRGYFSRTYSIHKLFKEFTNLFGTAEKKQKIQIINFGAGFDTSYFRYKLSKVMNSNLSENNQNQSAEHLNSPNLETNANELFSFSYLHNPNGANDLEIVFYEFDFPQVIQKKSNIIHSNSALSSFIVNPTISDDSIMSESTNTKNTEMNINPDEDVNENKNESNQGCFDPVTGEIHSQDYYLLNADLRDLNKIKEKLENSKLNFDKRYVDNNLFIFFYSLKNLFYS